MWRHWARMHQECAVRRVRTPRVCMLAGIFFAAVSCAAYGQQQVVPPPITVTQPAAATPAITLDEAIRRARVNEPNFAGAVAAQKSAALDRSIARAALLPSAVYHNQYIYTQPARCPSS